MKPVHAVAELIGIIRIIGARRIADSGADLCFKGCVRRGENLPDISGRLLLGLFEGQVGAGGLNAGAGNGDKAILITDTQLK